MKNYRARNPQYLALTKNFAKFQENEHTPGVVDPYGVKFAFVDTWYLIR